MAGKSKAGPKTKVRSADAGYVASDFGSPKIQDYVVMELRHDSEIAYSSNGFDAPLQAESAASQINNVLDQFNVEYVVSHFNHTTKQIAKRVSESLPSLATKKGVTAEFAHSGFVQLFPKHAKECHSLAHELNAMNDCVWNAYVAPRPIPAAAPTGNSSVSRNFEPAQGYMHSAPNGIGAYDAWNSFGAKGKGVKVCDIEGNWNFDHEDLPKLTQLGGELINDQGWLDHGTAVMGEIMSEPGRSGTVGISHLSRGYVHSAIIDGVFNTAGAITNAAARLSAGDVILIELQATGPNGKYVAMQYWDDVFSAIRAATDRGICVVEAAGNGNENFDLSIFNNTGLQKDSGAIVVGAGIPPTNGFDFHQPGTGYTTIGVPRSRIWFSNYGKIVNVQAWGWHVTTTGYGDAQGGRSQNRWYTQRFSGTSSASPIVTAAVACTQGMAKSELGGPMDPRDVRTLFIKTGTPQVAGPGVPLSQHIGPQPNLHKALKTIV